MSESAKYTDARQTDQTLLNGMMLQNRLF